MKKKLRIAVKPKVIQTASKFALIVGPILAFINHGDAMLDGSMDTNAWLKVGLTMLVPYTVSTLSSISAYQACQKDVV